MKQDLLTYFLLVAVTSASAQGKWTVLQTANQIEDRMECSAAAVDGKLYLIGGNGRTPKPVACFDPAAASWTTLAVAPVIIHHFQVVALGKKIYVLEAFGDENYPNQVPLSHVYIYDTEKNEWKQGAMIPVRRRRAGAGAAAHNGKLYLVGGIQHGHSNGTTNMFDMYDPTTDTWSKMPDAPHIRDHAVATVLNNKLYAIGGRNTSYHEPDNFLSFYDQTVLEVDCFDFTSGKWATLAARLPLGSGGGTSVSFNNKLFYIGGERATATEKNAPRKNTYFIDPATDKQWTETDSLHNARNGTTSAVIDSTIYLLGGSIPSTGGPKLPFDNSNWMTPVKNLPIQPKQKTSASPQAASTASNNQIVHTIIIETYQ